MISKHIGIATLPSSQKPLSFGDFYYIEELNAEFKRFGISLITSGTDTIGVIPLIKKWKDISKDSKFFKSSVHEFLLYLCGESALPGCTINLQTKVLRYKMDLEVIYNGNELYIEFESPSHFVISRYGKPTDIRIKKDRVESETKKEVINWPYWIPFCTDNVKSLLTEVSGFAGVWSCAELFSDFVFPDSETLITGITKRFKAADNGIGYMYKEISGSSYCKPAHPIYKNTEEYMKLIPKGSKNYDFWLPRE